MLVTREPTALAHSISGYRIHPNDEVDVFVQQTLSCCSIINVQHYTRQISDRQLASVPHNLFILPQININLLKFPLRQCIITSYIIFELFRKKNLFMIITILLSNLFTAHIVHLTCIPLNILYLSG